MIIDHSCPFYSLEKRAFFAKFPKIWTPAALVRGSRISLSQILGGGFRVSQFRAAAFGAAVAVVGSDKARARALLTLSSLHVLKVTFLRESTQVFSTRKRHF